MRRKTGTTSVECSLGITSVVMLSVLLFKYRPLNGHGDVKTDGHIIDISKFPQRIKELFKSTMPEQNNTYYPIALNSAEY